ncbi:MAG: hypothetical protein AB7Y46_05065 [Armatimonadota bacterium]
MGTWTKPGGLPEWFERGRIRWAWGGWEPPEMYIRAGSYSGGVNGRALWAPRWWDYLHSEQHVRAMAEMGINLITTHYYKGFGLRVEAAQMQRTRQLVQLCHAHGIHVLGYCQLTTVYPETMLDEIPDLEAHVQYGPDGAKRLYGRSCYFRWQGDLSSERFIGYLREVVTHGLSEIGLDGVEWDGTEYLCHCPRCVAAFREFLRESYGGRERELFGLPHFDHALPPPYIAGADPMYQAWLAFRTQTMHRRLRELYAHTKSVREDAIFATYPHAPQLCRPDRDRIMPWVGDYLDLATAETHEMPRVEADGRLVCCARHIKQCSALGVPAFVTAWIRDGSGYRAPQTPAEVKLSIAESACYGGHPFPATWMNRPWGREGKCLYHDPQRGPTLAHYMRFFAEHEDLYAGSTSLANVAVFYAPASCDFDREVALAHLQGLEQVLLQHQVPFEIIFGIEGGSGFGAELVCVPNQRLLSDDEAAALQGHLEAGGALLLTGKPGRFDQHYRERAADALAQHYGHPRVIHLPEGPERAPAGPEGRASPLWPYLPQRHGEVVAAVLAMLPRGLPVHVEAGRFIGVGIWRTAAGRPAVHLLNYANGEPAAPITISPAPWLEADAQAAELVTADEGLTLELAPGGRVVVRGLDTYAVVLL